VNTLGIFTLLACTPSGIVSADDTASLTGTTGPVDADQDGYSGADDCDDADPSSWVGAPETCDDVDNDCDGTTDEDAGELWYADADADGHGDPDASEQACDAPDGAVDAGTDCDDQDPDVHPDAQEICDPDGDTLDNDCDGLVDLDDPDLDPATAGVWFADADGDTYGDPDNAVVACVQPADAVLDDHDCDDSDPGVHPGAEELCDGVDNDCDGESDGDIRFTAFTSTYVYQGIESIGHLESEVINSPLLCTTSLTDTDAFSGPVTCGSGTSDVGYELALTFFVTAETEGTWSFRLGPDFGLGGALFLDGEELDGAVDDLWWNYSWDNTAELLEGSLDLVEGTYLFQAIGFEACCSGYSALQVETPGADWATVTPEGFGLECAE